MKNINSMLREFLLRNKRKIILLSFAAGFIIFAFVSALGIFAYKAFTLANGVQFEKSAEFVSSNVKEKVGIFESSAMTVTSRWLQEKLATSEVQSISSGLACIDAIGGPSPQSVIDYVKVKLNDERVLSKLDGIRENFAKNQTNGSAGCVSWVLGS